LIEELFITLERIAKSEVTDTAAKIQGSEPFAIMTSVLPM
jgi:hypothetical protein